MIDKARYCYLNVLLSTEYSVQVSRITVTVLDASRSPFPRNVTREDLEIARGSEMSKFEREDVQF
jgi:hypothetical protein